jgi:hypothetical protein
MDNGRGFEQKPDEVDEDAAFQPAGSQANA